MPLKMENWSISTCQETWTTLSRSESWNTFNHSLPLDEEPNSSCTFTTSDGYTIALESSGGKWQAVVEDNRFPGFKRSRSADVCFEPGYQLKKLIVEDSAYQSRHIHLFHTDTDRPLVYIGSCSLKGGGPLNWVGLESCWSLGCFEDVWKCICGYECKAAYCLKHCSTHYRDHQCKTCGTVRRCPLYYKCKTCFSKDYCHDCCGCYEKQKLAQEKEAAEREAMKLKEQERMARVRQQEEQERVARVRQEEEQERLARVRQEEERQTTISHLDNMLNTTPFTEELSNHLGEDQSTVCASAAEDCNRCYAYALVNEGTLVPGSCTLPDNGMQSDSIIENEPQLTSTDTKISTIEQNAQSVATSVTSRNSYLGPNALYVNNNNMPSFIHSSNDISTAEDKYAISRAKLPNNYATVPLPIADDFTDLSIQSFQSAVSNSFKSLFFKDCEIFKEQSVLLTKNLSMVNESSLCQLFDSLIQQQLSALDKSLQKDVLEFFYDAGFVYFDILLQCPPSEWVEQSLIREITCQTHDILALNQFNLKWLKISEQYPHPVPFLKCLKAKKISCNLSLPDIVNVLNMVLESGSSGYSTVCGGQDNWFLELKTTWLKVFMGPLLKNFSDFELSELREHLVRLNWDTSMEQQFLQLVKDDTSLAPILELLNTVKKCDVPNAIVLSVMDKPVNGGDEYQQWNLAIITQTLLYKVSRISPKIAREVGPCLAKLLQSTCSADLLEKVIKDNESLLESHTAEFSEVLELVYNYKITEDITQSVFMMLPKTDPSDWLKKVDEQIVSSLFKEAYVYDVDELIEAIAAKSPSVTTPELKSWYGSVEQAYLSPSVLKSVEKLKNRQISCWTKKQVLLWARKVKSVAAAGVGLSEIIAGVKRAVELHHKFTPRPAQILALLTLLHPVKGMGRLVQVNTGQGKSVIVAMVAAIHALQGKKVDIVTTSKELSIREMEKTPFFELLGLTVAENSSINDATDYQRDIIYGTAGDFQADILRTKFLGKNIRGSRGFSVVIVDEVDSMFYGNRTHFVRLSETIPGMNHLELALGVIWDQVNRTARHLTTVDDQIYYIPVDFERKGKTITLYNGEPWESCAVPVGDKRSFILTQTQDYLEKLLRKLDDQEKKEHSDYQALEFEISSLEEEIASTTSQEAKLAKKKTCEEMRVKLKNLPWEQRHPVLEIPVHLRSFANSQIPYWVKNALNAAFFYKRDAHYGVQSGRIVPIQYNETGAWQTNMVLSDGLTQFLQIKEKLAVDPESIATNLSSTVGFFKGYDTICGVSGTLDEEAIQDFFYQIYDTDKVIIAPHQYRPITDNTDSPYMCKELRPIVLNNDTEWYQSIIHQSLKHAGLQRAVLVICKYVDQVRYLASQLRSQYDPKKIFSYTGEDASFKKSNVYVGDIILATNIAGRGTDFITSTEVEFHGGLYVVVTFMPDSLFVELQNAGRTGRDGKKGMAQLIVCDHEGRDVACMKRMRSEREVLAINKAVHDAQCSLIQDALFTRFCVLESKYLPTASDCKLLQQWEKLTIDWKKYSKEKLAPVTVSQYVDQRISNRKQQLIASLSDEQFQRLRPIDIKRFHRKASEKAESEKDYFESKYRANVLNHFCNSLSNVPQHLIACLRENRAFEPNFSELAKKYSWGLHTRRGFEELWGFWLKEQHVEDRKLSLEEAIALFESSFSAPVEEFALKDKLVQNPYYYVLEGNDHVLQGRLLQGISSYNRAIDMDPVYSVNARYNKARALLLHEKNEGEYQKLAYEELQKAKEVIHRTYRPSLLAFNVLIAQWVSSCRTSEHIQHQLHLLNQQETCIDRAIKTIEEARQKKSRVKLTERTVEEAFTVPDEDRSKAIHEASTNGFTHVFTIQRKEPVPWHTVVCLALISVTQIAAGCLMMAYTGGVCGSSLILEGVSDMIACIKTAVRGSFDWAAWTIQKGISLALSLVSCGVQGIKKAVKYVSRAAKRIGACVSATKNQVRLAIREVSTALQKGVLGEFLTATGQWCTNKLFTECFEEKISDYVEEKITEALTNNQLVVEALKLDVENGNNFWQDLFVREGLSVFREELEEEKKEVCSYMAGEILSGVVGNKVNDISNDKARFMTKVALQSASSARALNLTGDYINKFVSKFNRKVESHKCDIVSSTDQRTQSSKISAASEVHHTVEVYKVPASSLEESDVIIDSEEKDIDYTSKMYVPKNDATVILSNPKSIANCFKNQITHTISSSLKQHLVSPVMDAGIHKLTNLAFREADQVTARLRNQVRTYVDRQNHSDELAHAQQEKEKHTGKAKRNKCELNKSAQEGIKRLRTDSVMDDNDLSLAAAVAGAPIRVYDKETLKLLEVVGQDLPGKPISLMHSSDNGGHWEPLDQGIAVLQSGNNTCLVDSVVAQLNPDKSELIQNSPLFKQKMIDYLIQHPDEANRSYETRDKLKLLEDLRSGGKGKTKIKTAKPKESSKSNSKDLTKSDVKDLKDQVGKNSVSVPETRDETVRYRYDLDGRAHQNVETPHVQREIRNETPEGEVYWNKDRDWVRPMTEEDRKVVEEHLNKKN